MLIDEIEAFSVNNKTWLWINWSKDNKSGEDNHHHEEVHYLDLSRIIAAAIRWVISSIADKSVYSFIFLLHSKNVEIWICPCEIQIETQNILEIVSWEMNISKCFCKMVVSISGSSGWVSFSSLATDILLQGCRANCQSVKLMWLLTSKILWWLWCILSL